MSYRVWLTPQVIRAIASWGLPDPLLVEIYLRLNSDLTNNPAAVLRRVLSPFEGLVYQLELIDPANRLCVHHCVFHVLYSQDEEQVLVAHLWYARMIG